MITQLERFWFNRYMREPYRTLFSFGFLFMIIGIVLSVTILSSGLNLFEGYQRTLKKLTLDTIAHISISSASERTMELYETELFNEVLKQQKEVKSVFPVLTNSVMMQHDNKVRGCYLKSYQEADLPRATFWKYVSAPTPKQTIAYGHIIVGYHLAKELGLDVGDTTAIVYPQLERVTPMGFYPSERKAVISGLYRSGFYEYDRGLILCRMDFASELLGSKDRITYIDIELHDRYIDKAERISTKFEALIPEQYYASPWNVHNQGLFRLIILEKWLIFILFSFLVLIAGINVISTVTALIYEKKAEIAVMKTLGATDRVIRRLFYYRIALVCVASVLIGQLLGVLSSWAVVKQGFYQLKGEVYFIDTLAMHISPINQLAIFLVATMMCFACIFIPLKQISKLQIIDVLRNK